MARATTSSCLRCGERVPGLASYCPACGLRARGPGRLLGLLPAALAGATVAAVGVSLQQLAGPMVETHLEGASSATQVLFGLSAEVIDVADALFVFAGAGMTVLALGRPRLPTRLAAGVLVAGLAAASHWACAAPVEVSRVVLVAAAALAGAGLGGGVLSWASHLAPFRWVVSPVKGWPWQARYLAVAPAVAVASVAVPWLVLGLFAVSSGRWLRSGPLTPSLAPAEAGPEGS